MRNVLRLALSAFVVAALAAGCGGDDGSGSSTDGVTTTRLDPDSLPSAPAKTYTGTGADIIGIEPPFPDAPFLVTVTTSGSDAVIVDALDIDGVAIANLVNAEGPYTGTVPVDANPSLGRTAQLQVDTTGPWEVEVNAVRSAPVFDTVHEGTGDEVLLYLGETRDGSFIYEGEGTAVVVIYPSVSGGLPTTGVTADGPSTSVFFLPSSAVLQVQATGPWTVTILD
jgi:hypothetical protein